MTFGAELYIGWFQIAMNDAFVMGGLKSLGDLSAGLQGLRDLQRSLFQPFGEGLSFDEFQDQVMFALVFFKAENGGDVGMVQSGQRFGLTFEACQAFRVVGKLIRQDLDCDVAVELGIGGAVDLAHAPLAKLGGDSVMRDGLVDHGGSLPDYPAAVSHRRASSRAIACRFGQKPLLFSSVRF